MMTCILPTQAQRQIKTLRLTQKPFLIKFSQSWNALSLSLLRVTLQATSIVFHYYYEISIMGVFKMGFS